jgi:spore maturation protein CgeB
MKILKISIGDVNHINKILNKKFFKRKTFEDYVNLYLSDNIIFNPTFKDILKKINIEVFHVVYNDFYSQKKWVSENLENIDSDKKDLDFLILLKQIEIIKPDILFLIGGVKYRIKKELIDVIKSKYNCKIFVWWGDEIHENPNIFFSGVDELFVTNKLYYEKFKKFNLNSKIMEYPFDSLIDYKNKINFLEKKEDFVFAGNSGFDLEDHKFRYNFLKNNLKDLNIKIFTDENKKKFFWNRIYFKLPSFFNYLLYKLTKRGKIYIDKNKQFIFNNLSLKEIYPNKIFRAKYGKEYQELIYNTRKCLNIFRDEYEDVLNIRCVEAVSLNACLITNKKKQMKEYFDCENEIIGFDTEEEFFDKIRYLDNNPLKASEISNNAFKKKDRFNPAIVLNIFLETLKKY